MKLIMIDTNIMKGSGDTDKLPDADTIDYKTIQDEWFATEIKTCKSTYCIVVGHHPVFSIGVHGPTSRLIDYIVPLMEENYGMF